MSKDDILLCMTQHDLDPYLQTIRQFSPSSHKGQNGKVLLIGGSELFHAASRWCLDTVSAMVDMVFYSSTPENNELIKEAKKEFWGGVVIPRGEVESYLQEADVIVIGPGMVRDELTENLTNHLVSTYPHKKWVIDAGALQMIDPKLLTKTCIITPHHGELDRVLAKGMTQAELLATGVTILLKGERDHVMNAHREEWVDGGNAGMTKGGTGDALAGLVAGLYTRSDDPFAVSVIASSVNKMAGDALFESVGPFFTTAQLVEQIPKTLKQVFSY